MQTNFSPAQLKYPATAEAEKILRTCVHCGFCTATCPTFVLLGDELDSPRGRIYLIKDMLEKNRPADALTVKHIDRCLSCLACMTACPSGVNYMHLVDGARSHIEKTFRRPLADRLFRAFLGAVLPYPNRFRLALAVAPLARLSLSISAFWPDRLRPGCDAARCAKNIASPRRCWRGNAVSASGAPLPGWRFSAAVQQALRPDINSAAISLCCRGLAWKSWFPRAKVAAARSCTIWYRWALVQARQTSMFGARKSSGADLMALITASGCGTMIMIMVSCCATSSPMRQKRRAGFRARQG